MKEKCILCTEEQCNHKPPPKLNNKIMHSYISMWQRMSHNSMADCLDISSEIVGGTNLKGNLRFKRMCVNVNEDGALRLGKVLPLSR